MSTNILDLPTGPPNQSPPNVVLETSTHQQALQPPPAVQQPPPTVQQQPTNIDPRGGNMNNNNNVDPSIMNKVIADIQPPSISGGTQFASRDINMDSQQQQHVQDEQIKPNFLEFSPSCFSGYRPNSPTSF